MAVVRMTDVAKAAGVSTMTVSNVINGRRRVGPETRARVLAAMSELEYQVNHAARNLRSGRTGVVGLAVPRLERPYFAELAARLANRFEVHGLRVVVERTKASRQGELDAAAFSRLRMYDGLVLSVVDVAPAELEQVRIDSPLVLIGERTGPSRFDHVMMENVDGARLATAHLLAAGARRVALLGGETGPNANMATLRTEGYLRAHVQAGVDVDPRLLLRSTSYSLPDGYAAIGALLDRSVPFDAVFAMTDVVAMGAMRALADAGRRVPEDVQVVGFDDIAEAAYLVPSLTSVSPGHEQIADAICEYLLERMDVQREAGPAREMTVPARLVERQSTKRVPPNLDDASIARPDMP